MNFKNTNKNIFKILASGYLMFFIFLASSTIALAADPTPTPSPTANPTATAQNNDILLQVPILEYTRAQNIVEYIAKIYQAALYILVPATIVVIIISGIQWILAGGDSGKIKAAKGRIVNAFLGLLIGLLSYTVLSLIGLGNLSLTGGSPTYIEPMPIPIEDGEFEQPDAFNQNANPGAAPVAGTMPRIFQCDYRNVKFNCASKTVCSSGCGTVSVTMVLRYYGKNVSIEQAVQFMSKVGAIGCGIIGTSPTGFKKIAEANGLKYSTIPINFETIKNYVANGKPIIANVGDTVPASKPCDKSARTCKFTGCGHFIVLSGWDAANNRFIVNDPGGRATNRYNGTWNELAGSCNFKGAYYVGK